MFNEIIFIQEAHLLELNASKLLDRIIDIENHIKHNGCTELLEDTLSEYAKQYDIYNERLAYINSMLGLSKVLTEDIASVY